MGYLGKVLSCGKPRETFRMEHLRQDFGTPQCGKPAHPDGSPVETIKNWIIKEIQLGSY